MRLLPRFSLRFAWIALTIFLLVFGVGARYWVAYQEHERVATKLSTLGYNVEEETQTLLGWVIGKQITGLQMSLGKDGDPSPAELLAELPDPRAMRRLTLDMRLDRSQVTQLTPLAHGEDKILTRIGEMTELEVLDLTLNFAETDVRPLRALGKLRSLDLSHCLIPQDKLLPLLSHHPALEHLALYAPVDGLNAEELFQLDLPRLRSLVLGSDNVPDARLLRCTTLPFTKAGFGRFPQLEYLALLDLHWEKLECAAGALPRLKSLELVGAQEPWPIPWDQFGPALPALTALVIEMKGLNSWAITELSSSPTLQQLCLWGAGMDLDDPRLRWLAADLPQRWTEHEVEIFDDVLRRCKHLQLFGGYLDYLKNASPPPNYRYPLPSWDSDHWRVRPVKGEAFAGNGCYLGP